MSLVRTDTGEAATPLSQLQEMNKEKKADLENSLLKEALAISNERCNGLIQRQNMLVADLTTQVESVKESNDWHEAQLESNTNRAIREIRQIMESERTFKEQVSKEISAAARAVASEATGYVREQIDQSTQEVKKELSACVEELSKQRREFQTQGLFRRILFWATPALLLVQTVILAFLLIT